MMHPSSEKPVDSWSKLVFWWDTMKPQWNYTLAYYKNGRWLEVFDDDDITCPAIEFWADVEVPNQATRFQFRRKDMT